MLKNKLTAIAVAVSIGLAPVAASAQRAPVPVPVGGSAGAGHVYGLVGCVLSIMIAATDKGRKYKKELTTDEALTCGLLYWVKEANKKR
ncbi:MAG: hypothetical protein KF826_12015 [Xanthobacteraceae bacterium]|nr:hypothetical protein [Xanthobacteraceae bacterium]MBX3523906.1 hypothetical protein [Xanthobacteraceae bacterium]MBX3535068.1 hypothetical protein [Xanthobacteraceae bacterium]MBX3548598.1 hypothetical protein [Xanthobacteraceae bacterium]MCW5673851.1 hypothetical protein [Xanthobacteraceae bacterium]